MKRCNDIDVTKGIGIFLIVLSHLLTKSNILWINQLIYSFHIPLFFMCSGMVAKKFKGTKWELLKKTIYAYYLPAIYWTIISELIFRLFIKHEVNILHSINVTFYITGSECEFNRPLWFLFVLGGTVLIFRLFNLYSLNIYKKISIMIVSFFIGFLLYKYKIHYFGICQIFIALGFYIFGNIYFNYFHDKVNVIYFIILCIIWLFFGIYMNNLKITLGSYILGNFLYFLIAGISGAIVWIYLAYWLKNLKFLQTIGQNTMLIVCCHYWFVLILRKLNFGLTGIPQLLLIIIYSILLILTFIPLNKLISIYFPFLLGKKYKK